MIRSLRLSLVTSFLFYTSSVFANSLFIDPLDERFDVSGFLTDQAYGFLPTPIIITDTAVKGGLGMAG